MALDEPPKAFSIHILFSLENKISQPNMATLRHNVMETDQGHNLGTQKKTGRGGEASILFSTT